ncbi:MAG TPA: type IX secretion system membrane protein PorP/SprF [Chitinophagaceae bacterium]|jgi:type IX secretion system PorP/SprF family membrane protein|nr:type IX secretion system membrane protein PorP/SprF [Chitinophagaceae bacterium]
MKKFFVIISMVLANAIAFGQQRPHYTQYILNNYILNPAISGIENYTDVKLSVRDQWVGLNGAPRTAYFTIHGPIGKTDYRTTATSYSIPGENPRGKAYWESYTAAEPHHGIGFAAINDRTGSFNRFTAYVTYAYHIGLNSTTNLAGGFSAGITKIGLDKSKTDFSGTGDPNDPAAGAAYDGYLNKVKPDIGVGLWLYSRDYFIGLSAQQVVPQKLTFVDDAIAAPTGRLIPHLFLTGGYRFLLTNDINAIPSLMVKYIRGSSENDFQFETNLKLQYQDRLWIGGSYRYQDGYAAMLGLNVSNTFNIGYAYDFTTTKLNTVSRGTHEIVLGFVLGNKYSEACPRCNW